MNPTEFIKTKLQNIYPKFEGIKIRYENRISTHSHKIEIIPLNIFDENKNYMNEEEKIEHEFEFLYPDENIVFVSSDSLTKIKHAEFILAMN